MRLWLAARVNRRWPEVAYLLIVGLETYLLEVQARLETLEAEDEAPEPQRSMGKPGSRPEDLGQ